MVKFNRIIGGAALMVVIGAILSGCTSIKIPDFDFIKFPEFKEEAKNVPDYPSVADAPPVPKGIRSDKAWDQSAKNVLAKRDAFVVPNNEGALTDAQTVQKIQNLGTKVEEYKKDDPQ